MVLQKLNVPVQTRFSKKKKKCLLLLLFFILLRRREKSYRHEAFMICDKRKKTKTITICTSEQSENRSAAPLLRIGVKKLYLRRVGMRIRLRFRRIGQ